MVYREVCGVDWQVFCGVDCRMLLSPFFFFFILQAEEGKGISLRFDEKLIFVSLALHPGR